MFASTPAQRDKYADFFVTVAAAWFVGAAVGPLWTGLVAVLVALGTLFILGCKLNRLEER